MTAPLPESIEDALSDFHDDAVRHGRQEVCGCDFDALRAAFSAALADARRAERERCARVVDGYASVRRAAARDTNDLGVKAVLCEQIAAAIRAMEDA